MFLPQQPLSNNIGLPCSFLSVANKALKPRMCVFGEASALRERGANERVISAEEGEERRRLFGVNHG